MNFREPIWVRAEILQAKENRGHTYLELVQKDTAGDQIAAKQSAALWAKQRLQLTQKMPAELSKFLSTGTEVSLLVDVTFHSIYGINLSILDIDPAYTLGRMQIRRAQTIEQLQAEGLWEKNKSLLLPAVIQRVAVISSSQAAGYQDFLHQIKHNEYGYAYQIKLFENAMQGPNVQPELLQNFARIEKTASDFDCIVIIRGGGSRLDLQAFDQYEICRRIAVTNIPVLTGIGHEVDTCIADMIAHRAFKTPTAVGAFLVERNQLFSIEIHQQVTHIISLARQQLKEHQQYLLELQNRLQILPQHIVAIQRGRLHDLLANLSRAKKVSLRREWQQLQTYCELIRALDPIRVFERGYIYARQNHKLIKSVNDLDPQASLETVFSDGTVLSSIEEIKNAHEQN